MISLCHSIFAQMLAMYVSELAPKQLRGKLSSMVATMAAVGILVSQQYNNIIARP